MALLITGDPNAQMPAGLEGLGGALGGGMGGGAGGADPPGTIRVTQEEKEAIERLE